MLTFGKAIKEDEKLKEANEAHEAALEKARACLSVAEFVDFRASYELSRETTIKTLIKYATEETDPIKFAFGARDLLLKLDMIERFLESTYRKAGIKYAKKA